MVRVKLIKLNVVDSAKLHIHTPQQEKEEKKTANRRKTLIFLKLLLWNFCRK